MGHRGGSGSRPVSRILSRTIIHLGRPSPDASCDLPGNTRGPRAAEARFPIWSCSERGLPCHSCCQERGALLPHLFTLTGPEGLGRYVFCGTFRRLAPPRRYLALCPVESGLSSADMAAIAWPTPETKLAPIQLPDKRRGWLRRSRCRQAGSSTPAGSARPADRPGFSCHPPDGPR